MRILIVGAGAVGGYVGARLLAAGKDVTFLVRPPHAAQLARTGLALSSPLGDCAVAAVNCISADNLRAPYDLVVLTCKVGNLADALVDIAPAIAVHTSVLPLLNGIGHLDLIAKTVGAERLIGGQCTLAVRRSGDGRIHHLNQTHRLTLGELDGPLSQRIQTLAALFGDAGFQHAASPNIRLEMWEKLALVASAFGLALLTRVATNAGPIVVHTDLARTLLNECRATAASAGFDLRTSAIAHARMVLEAPNTALSDLIIADLPGPVAEADLLLDDLIRRAREGHVETPLALAACAVLRAFRACNAGPMHPV